MRLTQASRPGPGPRPLIPCSLCSPDGYLYEREAILEYILHQKKEIARQMKVLGMGKAAEVWVGGLGAEFASRATRGLPSKFLSPLAFAYAVPSAWCTIPSYFSWLHLPILQISAQTLPLLTSC